LRSLLDLHRDRLKRMVELRLDRRVAPRLDPSDIVQEAFADAARKLADYDRERPLPFYPWLHCLAQECVVQAHRKHLHAKKRTVRREEVSPIGWPSRSTAMLVDRLVDSASGPSRALEHEERRKRLHRALESLAPAAREILVMRYLDDLKFPEIAAILGIGESAARMRHLRALQDMKEHLDDSSSS
jgi:RNA polymerase sigma-70 factor (ECF subfamily)